MVEDFVMDCEKICGRQSHSLRATLLSQAKKFVERFHEERKNKLRWGICSHAAQSAPENLYLQLLDWDAEFESWELYQFMRRKETILFDKPHSYFESFDSFGSAGKHDWCLVWLWLVEKIVLVLLDQSQSKGKRNQNNPEFLWTQWKSLSFSR